MDRLAGLKPGHNREGLSLEADLDLFKTPETLSMLEGLRDCLETEVLGLLSILTASLSCWSKVKCDISSITEITDGYTGRDF